VNCKKVAEMSLTDQKVNWALTTQHIDLVSSSVHSDEVDDDGDELRDERMQHHAMGRDLRTSLKIDHHQ
jgi:hypothetical protein